MSSRAHEGSPHHLWGWLLCACAVLGCNPNRGAVSAAPVPPAEVFETTPEFVGRWRGQVEEQEGELRITPLSADGSIFRGVYRAQGLDTQYILKCVRRELGEAPTNQLTFTWQDGRGGEGTGWLMINRDGTAITGAFGQGGAHDGGTWTFSRAETPPASPSRTRSRTALAASPRLHQAQATRRR